MFIEGERGGGGVAGYKKLKGVELQGYWLKVTFGFMMMTKVIMMLAMTRRKRRGRRMC